MFDNPEAAMQWVRDRQDDEIQSIDVGCMQINLYWHEDAFQTLADGFDPARNVDYAARFLRALSSGQATGGWLRALTIPSRQSTAALILTCSNKTCSLRTSGTPSSCSLHDRYPVPR
jgi:hypothetical protein